MDISINQIDLEYLTNYSHEHHFTKKKQNDAYKTDLDFYKKRIFKLTKDLLRGHKCDSTLDACFKNYTRKCIDHFKFIDKRDIIQEDYKNVKEKEEPEKQKFNMIDTNNLMMKKLNRSLDISHLLNIKSKTTAKKIVIPKERNLNLKHPKYKIKGLEKKKNINNKYEEKNKKKKK